MEINIVPGQDADINRAEPMLENIDPDAFLADRAYGADRLIDRLTERVILSSSSSINLNSSVASQPAMVN